MTKTETHTNKTILRVIFAGVAVLLFCGAAIGAAGAADHSHEGWTAWGNTEEEQSSLPAGAGSYYLTHDITLSSTWNVPTGETNLCLNGYVIHLPQSGRGVNINKDCILNLYDCNSTNQTHNFTVDLDGPWTPTANTATKTLAEIIADPSLLVDGLVVSIPGGCMIGAKGSAVVTNNTASVFNMFDGNIVGNSSTTGGGVYVSYGMFKMSGGNIVGNSVHNDQRGYGGNGGGVYLTYMSPKFIMSGGNIVGNSATSNGGGVYATTGNTFNVSGSPVIKGNMKTDGTPNNVHLNTGKYITIIDDLTAGAYIGIASNLTTVDASRNFATGAAATTEPLYAGHTVDEDDAKYFHPDDESPIKAAVTSESGQEKENSTLGWVEKKVAKIENVGEYTTVKAAVTAIAAEGLTSGVITMIDDSTEPTITIPANMTITLDLAGHVLKNKPATALSIEPVITVKGNLTVKDTPQNLPAVHKFSVGDDGLWILDETHGTQTLTGGCITGGTGNDGGGDTSGGGVYINSGMFVLEGGHIVGNSVSETRPGYNSYGGGIYVGVSSTFTMSGGSITGNIVKSTNDASLGGGVFVDRSTFTMTKGSIVGNTATKDGGGVYLSGSAEDPCTFEMSGSASIVGNTATNGNGGGVFIREDSKLLVSGSPSIKGNKGSGDADNNVVLKKVDTNAGLFLTDNFTGDIRITLVGGKVPVAGEPFGWVTGSPSGAENFKADGPNLVGSISDGKLVWKAPASKSSSKSQGTSTWLTETPAPTTPTPTPAVTPTPDVPQVKPVTPTETPAKTPAPFLGILAGLGAAVAVFGLRMRR